MLVNSFTAGDMNAKWHRFSTIGQGTAPHGELVILGGPEPGGSIEPWRGCAIGDRWVGWQTLTGHGGAICDPTDLGGTCGSSGFPHCTLAQEQCERRHRLR